MKDALDLILDHSVNSDFEISKYISQPLLYKTSKGADLFGFQTSQISKAALYYYYYMEQLSFKDASNILATLKLSLSIEELALLYKRAFFINIRQVPFLKEKKSIKEIIIELYSQFSGMSEMEISELLVKRKDIYAAKWSEIIPDEDNVTPEQLGLFYNSLPFPIGCLHLDSFAHNLASAYQMLPVLLAKENNAKRVFDYGGNSGHLTSVLTSIIDLETSFLIEENEVLLNFAKWRDKLLNVNNVTYKKESELLKDLDLYQNYFDFGICTEVLEHVFYVEETVETFSKILKSGGLLYLSTSFGLYPTPSHLKKNTKYHGKEDQLLGNFGFERINAQFPIPLLSSHRVYRKK